MRKPLFFMSLVLSMLLCACGNSSSPTTNHTTIDSTSSEETKKVDVIFLAGQSNMEGHTHISELQKKLTPTQFQYYSSEMTTRIKFYCDNGKNKSSSFTNVYLGQGVNASRYGPEIGIAETLEKANLKREVILIKFCLGGTNIYSDWRSFSSSSSNSGSRLFNEFLDFGDTAIAELEEMGLEVNVRGLCWMQGESDATQDRMTEKYEEYEKNLFDDIYQYFEDKVEDEFHIFDAYISDCSTWKNYAAINQAKKNNATNNPNHHIIDTLSEGLEYDSEPTSGVDYFHYDSLSMIKLGQLFGEQIISYALKD